MNTQGSGCLVYLRQHSIPRLLVLYQQSSCANSAPRDQPSVAHCALQRRGVPRHYSSVTLRLAVSRSGFVGLLGPHTTPFARPPHYFAASAGMLARRRGPIRYVYSWSRDASAILKAGGGAHGGDGDPPRGG